MYLIPFNAEGGFYNDPLFAIRGFKINDINSANAYLNWLRALVPYLKSHIAVLQKGMSQGIIAPEVIVKNTLQLLEPFTRENLKENPLYTPFNDAFNELNDKEIKHLSSSSEVFFRKELIPAYETLVTFFKEDYLPKAYMEPGIYKIPEGRSFYEDRIRHFTTLPLTSEEVHAVGLREVERIRDRMIQCVKESGFDGSLEEFIDFLRTHPRFYPARAEDLLYKAAWLSKKAEGRLPEYFKKLPELPFTVEPVPESIAPTYTAGRFVHGSWKNRKTGIYWVNTFKLDSRPLYALPALTLHEAVPGHHLQTQLAAEQDNLSDLRRYYYISAFGEGWGLYAEYLGEEMGMYSDAYELFGRLTYEMWRACRLVVDTGIHSKGWSREKAFEFLKNNTALSIHEVNTEIDRYIGWPGQAVSYKIGELKILELRERAEEALGDKFDIRDFHFEILKNGSVPLPVLESVIYDYIAANK
jgi:uncharacterized protein (DUF885 family)